MPTHEYHCAQDGPFDKTLSFVDTIPPTLPCPRCRGRCSRVLRAPAAILVRGGTGAGSGHAASRALARSDSIRSLGPNEKARVQRGNVLSEVGLEITDAAEKAVARGLAGA